MYVGISDELKRVIIVCVCLTVMDEMFSCVCQAGDESSEEEEGEVDSEVEFPRRQR